MDEEQRRATFEQWVLTYGPALQTSLLHRVAHAQDRQDLLQETLAAGYRALCTGARPEQPGQWLAGILRHKLHDWYAAQARQAKHTQALETDWHPSPAPAAAPGDHAEQQLLLEAVLEALARMDEKYRDVLMMRLINEYSFAQIAEVLAVKEATVRVQFMRGTKQLAELLRRHGFTL